MSRFGNLELGGEFEEPQQSRLTTRDEHYYLAEGLNAFAQADFEQALRSYARALEYNPASTPAWSGQVKALIELGEFHEGKLWADKALERFPHDPELLASKAVALGRLGDLDAAMAFSDASIEERGDTPYIWLARGDVLLARGEKRADYCFDKARTLAAADWFVHWLVARIRAFYKQFSLALKAVQQALELKPDHAILWSLAGQCQEALGLIDPARHSFAQALQLNPRAGNVSAALNRLADVGLFSRLRGWWKGRNRQ